MSGPPAAARRRVLVLLSGGVDSTVALQWSLARGDDATALLIRFPGQPPGERAAARAVAAATAVQLVEADAPWLMAPADARPEGYIPHRNVVFYGLAFHIAAREGFDAVVGGHNREDGEAFPDATSAFFRRLEELMRDATPDGRRIGIELPLIGMPKRDVVRLGRELGAPVGSTWSCYREAAEPCGRCVACVERAAAFA